MRARYAAALAALILLELFLAAAGSAHADKQPSQASRQEDGIPEFRPSTRFTGTAPPVLLNSIHPPKPLWDFFIYLRTAASYAAPLIMSTLQEREQPRQGIRSFSGPGENDPPPMVWSRLNITSTAYVYDSAWGRYVFPKALPVSVFFHSLADDGYCEKPNPDPDDVENPCLTWHHNYSVNATALIWLQLNSIPMIPVSFSVITATDTMYEAYAVGASGGSLYYLKIQIDFSVYRPTPKLTMDAGRVSGPSKNFRIVLYGVMPDNSYVDMAGSTQPLTAYSGTQANIGRIPRLRIAATPENWSRYFLFDSTDSPPEDTWLGSFNILGQGFTGFMMRYEQNKTPIDPGFYVVQPGTVTVNWGSTGDKTLLQITDNLPAGNKIVLFALGRNPSVSIQPRGTLKIVSESMTLVQEGITYRFNQGGIRAKPALFFAYHASAPANAQYTFIATVTMAASASTTLHVQGMVILLTAPAFFTTGSNMNIAAGATVNLATINTNYPAGSKVAVLAYLQLGPASGGEGHRMYQAGSIRIVSDSAIVSQNQFSIGAYATYDPLLMSLSYFTSSSVDNPSYSIQVYNNLSGASQAWGEIIAFRVGDGAFLDTGSLALTNGNQVTVGNLSTSLDGEVGVIALAAAENTGTSNVTAFNAGDVVLQLNNQATNQVANQEGWYLDSTSSNGRSGVYALFRADTDVSSPSYQVKMTARASGINGEAKILAFTLGSGGAGFTISLSETAAASDSLARVIAAVRSASEAITASDVVSVFRVFPRTLFDAVSAVDAAARQATLTRLVPESITAAETLTRVALFPRTLSNTAAALDSLSRQALYLRWFADTITVSEQLQGFRRILIGLADILSASDTLIRQALLFRNPSENINPSESIGSSMPSTILTELLTVYEVLQASGPPQGGGTGPIPIPDTPMPVSMPDIALAITIAVVLVGAGITSSRMKHKPMGEIWRRYWRAGLKNMRIKGWSRGALKNKGVRGWRRPKPHRDRFGE